MHVIVQYHPGMDRMVPDWESMHTTLYFELWERIQSNVKRLIEHCLRIKYRNRRWRRSKKPSIKRGYLTMIGFRAVLSG